MAPVTIALNILFASLVFTTLVGGLVWAALSSRGERDVVTAGRTRLARSRRLAASRTSPQQHTRPAALGPR